jgi:energy-coupling factor transporter ATP-binding protein EcfA2
MYVEFQGAQIVAQAISARGPQGCAFANVSLDVGAGQLAVIAGSGGSGRTSLLLALAGRMQLITGTVRVNEYLLPGDAQDVQRCVAVALPHRSTHDGNWGIAMSSDDEIEFTYRPETFTFQPDCYTWPRLGVVWGDDTVVLHVHCLRNVERRQFSLVGFIDVDPEDQISRVTFQAQSVDAEVIAFKGVGLTDNIVNIFMLNMKEPLPDDFSGQRGEPLPKAIGKR